MLANLRSLTWKLALPGIALMLGGCAAAYHDYDGCCVPYQYCQPRPLPYVGYEGCHCPTPIAGQRSTIGLDQVGADASAQ